MGWLSLVAELGININPYVQGLFKARGEASKFGNDVAKNLKTKLAGAFSAGAISAGARQIIKMGGDVADLASRFELTTREVQALQFVGEQAGASFEDMAGALKKLAIAREEALQSDGEKRDQFKHLGVSLDDLKGKGPVELFRQISEKIRTAGNSSEYLTSILGVMGRTSDSLIPAMKDGIDDLIGKFDELGLAIEDGTIKRLDQIGDEWAIVTRRMKKDASPVVAFFYDLGKLFLKTSTAGYAYGLYQGKNPIDVTAEALAETTTDPGMFAKRKRKPGRDIGELPTKEKKGKTREEREESLKSLGRLSADSLASAGTFIGRAALGGNQVLDVARKSLRVQEKIADNTDPSKGAKDKFSYS